MNRGVRRVEQQRHDPRKHRPHRRLQYRVSAESPGSARNACGSGAARTCPAIVTETASTASPKVVKTTPPSIGSALIGDEVCHQHPVRVPGRDQVAAPTAAGRVGVRTGLNTPKARDVAAAACELDFDQRIAGLPDPHRDAIADGRRPFPCQRVTLSVPAVMRGRHTSITVEARTAGSAVASGASPFRRAMSPPTPWSRRTRTWPPAPAAIVCVERYLPRLTATLGR
jgi:hypothetical protein